MNFTIMKHDKHSDLSFISRIFIVFLIFFSNKTLAAMFNKISKSQHHPPIRSSLVGHVPPVGVSLTVLLQSGSGVLHLGEVFSPVLKCVCVRVRARISQYMYTHTRTRTRMKSCSLVEDLKHPDNLKTEKHLKKGKKWRKLRVNEKCLLYSLQTT